MQDFNNKVAVITGGASGVGRSIGLLLAAEGCKIVVADIEQQAMDKVVAEVKAAGSDAVGVKCDVSSEDSMKAAAEQAFAAFGEVHLVFANAGVGTHEAGNMWEYNANEWKWGLGVNLWGVINSITAFMGRLVEQNQEAHFVVTGSGNGAFLMLPQTPIYTATKAAVAAITENLYFQVQAIDTPVKINALMPGPHTVDTGIFSSERNRPEALPADPNAADSGIRSVDDMQRMMKEYGLPPLNVTHPDEVAKAALAGLRAEQFWLGERSEKSLAAMKLRYQGLLEGKAPVLPDVL